MRKLILMATLVANAAFANEPPTETTQPAINAPIVALSAVDVEGDILKSLNTTEISRSQPTHQLCWEAAGLPIHNEYAVEEWVKSPAKAQFVDTSGHTYTIDGGKSHIITTKTKGTAGKILKCWQFSESDPIGNYEITIKINDWDFETLRFLVKP